MWLATAPLLEQDPPVPTATAVPATTQGCADAVWVNRAEGHRNWGNDPTPEADTLLVRIFEPEMDHINSRLFIEVLTEAILRYTIHKIKVRWQANQTRPGTPQDALRPP